MVAAFALDSDMLEDLKDWGVMDSKSLTKTQITNIAQKLYSNYPSRISCIVLKPLKYNEIIADMQLQGRTLMTFWLGNIALLFLLY